MVEQAPGDFLAVVGGRFLPVDEFKLDEETETDSVSFASSMQSQKVVTSTTYLASIKTRRDPRVEPLPVGERAFIFTEDRQIIFEDAITSASPTLDGADYRWKVDIAATKITNKER